MTMRNISKEELNQLELRVSDILRDKGKVLSVESGGGCQWDILMEIPKATNLGEVWSWGRESGLHVGGWRIDCENHSQECSNMINISFVCGDNDCDWCCD